MSAENGTNDLPPFLKLDSSGNRFVPLQDQNLWVRKSHTKISPNNLALIEYYRDAVERVQGRRMSESEALNYILGIMASSVLQVVDDLNSIAEHMPRKR